MATNRYGQIWHGDHHHINIRFPSPEARLKFQNEFEKYHASHDHEGDIPTFKCVTTKDLKLSTGSRRPQDLVKAESDKDYRITIDGYSWNEIHDYHNPTGYRDYSWYHVPTCCVPPVIVIDREFVDSGTLQRHPLSAIFGDMPADDFKSLIYSVQTDGFIDPIVRLYEGQILDGWHRYRAAQELNLIRKLKFREWDEQDEGDPAVFVLARNIERRHLTPGQRAQIAVAFNERFEHGTNRYTLEFSRGESKTRSELARQASVGESTIDRAIVVEKAGRSEEVIAGKKTATQVIAEEKDVSGVYFLQNETTGHIKIGYSSQVNQRVSTLQTGSSEPLKLLRVIEEKTKVDEFDLHERFKYLAIDGEWFRKDSALMKYITEASPSEDRAKQISRAGKAEQVISDEKTAGEVLEEQKAEKDKEREAAIALVKPRFQNAVETWRSSQVERLQKFERLPVGRTPLLESEYIKTYFELADPRIPQNTKPTAAHYEGAIECMQDRPGAFAEQLEGRHYRRIIGEWDESVLPQLIKRFQGPLLGYSTSQLKADAFEVRIRQAIRRQYEFQGRIPSQPFEILFEITEDAHAVLIQLNPKEWVRNGREISWAVSVLPEPIDTPAEAEGVVSGEKSASESISEETVKGLWEQITAEMKEWKQRHTGVIYASKSVLLDAYREQKESDRKGPATVAELTGILKLMDEDCRAYALRVRYLRSDLRNAFEAAQTGYFKARADLTAFINEKEISLSDFIEATTTQYHRTNVAEMFGQPSDIRKDSTLTTGIFEDWTGFMRVLYVDVKAPAAWVPIPKQTDEETRRSEVPSPVQEAQIPTVPDREASKLLKQKKQALKSMWDKRIQAARDYAGDSDTDLNQYLSLPDLEKGFAADEAHAYCADAFQSAFQRTSETNFHTVVKKTLESDVALEVLQEETRAMDTYAYDILKWEQQAWIQRLIEKEKAKSEKRTSVAKVRTEGNGLVHRQRNEQDSDFSAEAAPVEQSSAEEVSPMDPVWDAFNKHYPKWKAKYAESGCEENELIQASTESELLDALRVYRESDREGMPTAAEVKDMINLMKQQSYSLASHLRNLLRAEVDAQDEGETEQDPFHDVDLATVKADLEVLLKKVMPAEKHPLWHQICEDINDAYLDYENLPNDREIFAILLDCALTAIDELT